MSKKETEMSKKETEYDVPEALDRMAIAFFTRPPAIGTPRIKQNFGKLEFILDSDIVLKESDSHTDLPTFRYVDVQKGLEKENLIDAEEIIKGLKNKETVRELHLVYNPNTRISPADLNARFIFFLATNKVSINEEVSSDDLVNPEYLNQFSSFNMNCFKSILGMVKEIRRELDDAEPIANQLTEYFDTERDKLLDTFIKEQSGFVMEHFLNYEAMLARKKDKVMSLMRGHGKYGPILSDISNRREQAINSLVSFRVRDLFKNICSYNMYMYVFPIAKVLSMRYLVMFNLDEILTENGMKSL